MLPLTKLKKIFPDLIDDAIYTGKFPTKDLARKAVALCRKEGAIFDCSETAKNLKSEKAVYAQYKTTYLLFIVNENDVSIQILPWNWSETCYAYRPKANTDTEWEWWAMGNNLPMMIPYLFKLGAKSIRFEVDHIAGDVDKYNFYFLHNDSLHYQKDMVKFPPRPLPPPPKPEPPIPKSILEARKKKEEEDARKHE